MDAILTRPEAFRQRPTDEQAAAMMLDWQRAQVR
jgi:hypothetical protein